MSSIYLKGLTFVFKVAAATAALDSLAVTGLLQKRVAELEGEDQEWLGERWCLPSNWLLGCWSTHQKKQLFWRVDQNLASLFFGHLEFDEFVFLASNFLPS